MYEYIYSELKKYILCQMNKSVHKYCNLLEKLNIGYTLILAPYQLTYKYTFKLRSTRWPFHMAPIHLL